MSLLSNLKDTFIQSVYLLNLESQSQNKSNFKGTKFIAMNISCHRDV